MSDSHPSAGPVFVNTAETPANGPPVLLPHPFPTLLPPYWLFILRSEVKRLTPHLPGKFFFLSLTKGSSQWAASGLAPLLENKGHVFVSGVRAWSPHIRGSCSHSTWTMTISWGPSTARPLRLDSHPTSSPERKSCQALSWKLTKVPCWEPDEDVIWPYGKTFHCLT